MSLKAAPLYSHIPFPQFILDISLIKDVPLALFHQKHDDCSVMTTIASVELSQQLVTLNSPHLTVDCLDQLLHTLLSSSVQTVQIITIMAGQCEHFTYICD